MNFIQELLHKLSNLTMKEEKITDDIIMMNFKVVNAFIISDSSENCLLVDTGLANCKDFILKTAKHYFGDKKPLAIILTHGHFDHVGTVSDLAEYWDVPVYAHELEFPYLTGEKNYPVPDDTVDAGLVAKMSPEFPHHAIDISNRLKKLSDNTELPYLLEWKVIHTPGHTEGHISLYREKDGILISADAIISVKQESLFSVITQNKEVSGPPKYLTPDFKVAEESVKKLKNLNPNLILTSHGQPLEKDDIDTELNYLIDHFKEIAVPENSRYIDH